MSTCILVWISLQSLDAFITSLVDLWVSAHVSACKNAKNGAKSGVWSILPSKKKNSPGRENHTLRESRLNPNHTLRLLSPQTFLFAAFWLELQTHLTVSKKYKKAVVYMLVMNPEIKLVSISSQVFNYDYVVVKTAVKFHAFDKNKLQIWEETFVFIGEKKKNPEHKHSLALEHKSMCNNLPTEPGWRVFYIMVFLLCGSIDFTWQNCVHSKFLPTEQQSKYSRLSPSRTIGKKALQDGNRKHFVMSRVHLCLYRKKYLVQDVLFLPWVLFL